jgi:DNA-binding CsgD family transcriptional regulator
MRVVLVGRPIERERLRAELEAARIEIVGEFDRLGDADAAGFHADAVVVALDAASRQQPDTGDEWVGEALTRRELEVLELLGEGRPNKAIAERLGISDQTVKFHVASIIGKLGASNRTDAVRRALRRGLIDL